MRVLIVGCGYVGRSLSEELVRQGCYVAGLRRSANAAAELKSAGIEPITADITHPETLQTLRRDWDWVVNCVGGDGTGADSYRRTYLDGNRNLLAWLSGARLQRFVYTSSTSVYGQDDGSWVTEDDPAMPESPTAQILVETENLMLEAARAGALPVTILRLSGIYGYDRGYWLKQFLQGKARVESGGGRFLNMIHRDDVVGAAVAALQRGSAGSVVNVSDDEPATQATVLSWLAERLGKPVPTEDTPPTQRRSATNKRVSNRKLREELGYTLARPTFREGFEAELQRMGRGKPDASVQTSSDRS